MRIIMFYHSLRSCWKHSQAHFLRGVASELLMRGHDVLIYEPRHSWSLTHLLHNQGDAALTEFHSAFPHLSPIPYDPESLDPDAALDGADLVLVHEWNPPSFIARLGRHRARTSSYRLLFHDTHPRSVIAPETMSAYSLHHYDGVLAGSQLIRDAYIRRGWAHRAWTWYPAADSSVFQPLMGELPEGDVVCMDDWSGGAYLDHLDKYLIGPATKVGARIKLYGADYPQNVREHLHSAGIDYGGWLPNHWAPRVFARYNVAVHVPPPLAFQALLGIPPMVVFEALASGIPLITGPWTDVDGLFAPGQDFLLATDPEDMSRCVQAVLDDEYLARELIASGRRRIFERHTCSHRVDELLSICREFNLQEGVSVGQRRAEYRH